MAFGFSFTEKNYFPMGRIGGYSFTFFCNRQDAQIKDLRTRLHFSVNEGFTTLNQMTKFNISVFLKNH